MRALVWIGAIVAGVIVVTGVVAAIGSSDNTGETVRASAWADDVCGTAGAWEGALEGIRDELRAGNVASRRNDGGSGDSVEQTISIREAVDRAIRATEDTLQEGLKRAGLPDVEEGVAASGILRGWAQRTEERLRSAKAQLQQKPTSPAEAFALLGPPIQALAVAAVDGRTSFKRVAALDPELAGALDGSRNCRELQKEEP